MKIDNNIENYKNFTRALSLKSGVVKEANKIGSNQKMGDFKYQRKRLFFIMSCEGVFDVCVF